MSAAGSVSQRLTGPMAFADLGDLLLKVEGVLDAQNFPQASQRIRTFVQDASESPSSVLPDGAMSEAAVEASKGAGPPSSLPFSPAGTPPGRGW